MQKLNKPTPKQIFKTLLYIGFTFTLFTGALQMYLTIVEIKNKTVNAYNEYMSPLYWQPVGVNVPRAKAEVKTLGSVEEKIVYYADIYGVEKETALRIAKCESGFNPKAENENGSATGVYQFIRKTWKNNCDGDVYNADANIICFMRLYKNNKNWWECK
jgi:soluble lytic murein transglycosylase-like protein